jgi:hypothetical protein
MNGCDAGGKENMKRQEIERAAVRAHRDGMDWATFWRGGRPVCVPRLTKAKEPVVDRHLLPVLPAKVDRTKRVVESVWRAIDAEHFYPTPSPMNCPTCPDRDECRAWPR